jgi:Ca2+-binding EF-hand superfamily protein
MSKQPPPSPLLPALLLRLSSTTNFTLDELASHHSKYQKLTASHDHMSLPQFTNLMQIMGVRASSPIIAHIFKSIDVDGNNSIEFEEYVEFFSRLLKGNQKQIFGIF